METDLFLYLCEAVTISAAAGLLFSRNLFNSVLLFLVASLGIAGVFAGLGGTFVFIAQVAIYGGGISVLMLFTVMMTRNTAASESIDLNLKTLILPSILLALMVIKINRQTFTEGIKTEVTAYEIGQQLSGNYIFVFEYSTILLLVALVGAMIIATQKNNAS